ncbi:uncharacterized protein BDR25DRAFT_282954 [Lindgomyces ingoldianus]|uniref:Uncharacterized protein n=1 Tax=Lindgomyces ingoldianus TaxID=673940 RepID=A0ACB6R2B8_9PLEO|nr:uncharacterized protein BDR25DRAFT_282954 [Lindgomyces ingoldianus]KAF2473418.1 hypothetical protein BDR25DRAFT_282954 [Lindgomyces ingoldianus]
MDSVAGMALAINSDLYWTRFDAANSCFEDESADLLPIHILDVPAHPQSPSAHGHMQPQAPQQFSALKTLGEFLAGPNKGVWKYRLISMCQENSWSKLQITRPMLRRIVQHHEIAPDFLEVPLSFFDRSTDEEQSFCVPWTLREGGDYFEMFYTFRYAEYKGHPNEPYVIRQTGVYQKFHLKEKTCLWILVNPVPDSAAHRRVVDAFLNYQKEMEQNPLWLHCVVLASYFPRWREYLAAYEKRLLPLADTTAAAFIAEPLRVNHETLSKLRSLESHFMPTPAILQSFLDTLSELGSFSEKLLAHNCIHANEVRLFAILVSKYRRHALTFIRTAKFLQQRSNNTATLVSDTVAFKNQGVAQEQNGNMLLLTRSAVFLTVLTLFYLPWTFMTGLFGMNFFMMDQNTYRFVTSPKLWVYFVSAVVLTACTMLLYYVISGFPQLRKGRQSGGDGGIGLRQGLQRGFTDPEKSGGDGKKWS